jgi:hypothetical protein
MTSLSKNQVAKKRGRPAGSKNKRRVAKVVGKDVVLNQKDIDALLEDLIDSEFLCKKMHDTVESLELKIKNLEHKAMQYEVVIDYLETKLGIK